MFFLIKRGIVFFLSYDISYVFIIFHSNFRSALSNMYLISLNVKIFARFLSVFVWREMNGMWTVC